MERDFVNKMQSHLKLRAKNLVHLHDPVVVGRWYKEAPAGQP